MSKQRFVLVSSLLATALKQIIFAVQLGIEWFEKTKCQEMKNSSLSCIEHIAFPVLFIYLFQAITTPMGRHDERRQQEDDKTNPKPVQMQDKSLCNHSPLEAQLYWVILPCHRGNSPSFLMCSSTCYWL